MSPTSTAPTARAVLDALLLEGGNALLDVDYELELVAGDPAEGIARAAKEHAADEIVVGPTASASCAPRSARCPTSSSTTTGR